MSKTYEIKINQTEEQKQDPVCSAILVELGRQVETLNSIQKTIEAIPAIQAETIDRINKLVEGLKEYDITVSAEPKEDVVEQVSPIEQVVEEIPVVEPEIVQDNPV